MLVDKKRALNEAEESPSPAEADAKQNEAANSSDADTKDAKPEETKETLLDAVKDAVEVKVSTEESSDSENGEDGKTEGSESDQTEAEAAKAEDAEVKLSEEEQKELERFDNHPRFQALREERDTYKEGAEAYTQIRTYMEQNNLEDPEVAELFQVGSLLKNDIHKGIEWLEGYVHDLKVQTGNALPEDLQDQVDKGLVYPDTAQELAQTRSENERLKNQQDQNAERQNHDDVVAAQQNILGAVKEWESRASASDPDYAMKQSLVENKVAALCAQRGAPESAEQAVEWAKEAYEDVNSTLKVMRPTKTSTRPTPSGQVSTNAQPAPTNLLEAVTQAANG